MYRVLVIEDEPDYGALLKTEFEKENVEVILASNGKQGITMAAKHYPDFILLDLIIPEMNGVEFLEHLAGFNLSEIPVGILTVVPDGIPQESHGKDIFNKIVAYWVKDEHTPAEIVKKVKEYLNHRFKSENFVKNEAKL